MSFSSWHLIGLTTYTPSNARDTNVFNLTEEFPEIKRKEWRLMCKSEVFFTFVPLQRRIKIACLGTEILVSIVHLKVENGEQRVEFLKIHIPHSARHFLI
jgi:hypothetical protein